MVIGCNNKSKLPFGKMLLLGILAGMYIGLGAYGATIAFSAGGTGMETMVAKLIGAGIFPVGLMLVVLCGAELFTGNCAMTVSVIRKEITLGSMFRNWTIVYLANLIGGVLLAWLLFKSGLYGSEAMTAKAIGIAEAKVAIPLGAVIIRGIFCNVLVVLAVWMQTGAKDVIGKIFAMWFPIMLFVFAGFEHCIANMYFLPIGYLLGAKVTISQIILNNLIPVTIGNIIGGAIIIPMIYYYSYLKKEPQK
ncbi:FdhC protein [Acetobacterium bakii]|uniref:FdhC protein n=2 Tax=Acetobacterium bakii TaxID=52689 RepID=A0A0L6TWD0_9FIRM|nr:FdhC protein [Acetobacterium bakii]